MANKRWRGDALARAEIWTITVANTWAAADTGVITINGKDLTLTVGTDATTANVATALKEMFNGDTQTGTGDHDFSETGNNVAEFNEITATVSGSVVTLTHDTKGVTFEVTVSETTAGTGTLTAATPTDAAGSTLFDDADNWDTNGVPADSDALIFDNSDNDLTENLSNAGIGPATIDILQSFTGAIGRDLTNSNDYYEYREDYLILGDAAITTTINVGRGEGAGSGRLKLDLDAGQVVLNVFNTGSPSDNGLEALLFKGSHASNVVNVRKGSVGIAAITGETATVATLRVGYISNREGDAQVRCGSGVTLTTLEQTGGIVILNAGLTTVTQTAGELTINAGNVTTLTVNGGACYYNGTDTITTANIRDGATLDLTRGQGTCTITTFNVYAGATIKSPKGRFGSAPTIRLNGCTINEITIEFEDDFDITHV